MSVQNCKYTIIIHLKMLKFQKSSYKGIFKFYAYFKLATLKKISKEQLILREGKVSREYIAVHSGSVKVFGEQVLFFACLTQLLSWSGVSQQKRSYVLCFLSKHLPSRMFLFVPVPETWEPGASSPVPARIQAVVEQPSPPCLPLLLSALGDLTASVVALAGSISGLCFPAPSGQPRRGCRIWL